MQKEEKNKKINELHRLENELSQDKKIEVSLESLYGLPEPEKTHSTCREGPVPD